VSGRFEHPEGWHDELAAYSLDALEEAERDRVERHLEGCGACRERVRWLWPAIDMLPAAVAQQDPPPALRERLMAIVEDEAAAGSPARPEARVGARSARRRRSWLPGLGGALRPALAGFGVALLLAAGVVGYSLRDDESSSSRTYAAVPLSGRSPAEGTLTVEGDSGSLEVRNLPPAGRHEVYQTWIRHTGNDGGIEPSTVFVLAKDGSGHVRIPSGLEGADEVMVTREPVGGSEKPHESPLILAKLG